VQVVDREFAATSVGGGHYQVQTLVSETDGAGAQAPYKAAPFAEARQQRNVWVRESIALRRLEGSTTPAAAHGEWA